MQLIANLSDMIEEELEDADKYIRCAMKHKEDNLKLADTFYKISVEEIGHMSLLHDQVVAIISDYRKERGEPPEKMLGIYEYLHKKHKNRADEIKVLQALYKG